MKTVYTDRDGNPVDRLHATFDPHGRPMATCISCPEATTQHLIVFVDGHEYHTHVCDDCAAILFSLKQARVETDPLYEVAA